MNDVLMSVLKSQFLKFMERFVAAPLIVVLVSHGIVSPDHANAVTQSIAEVCGWAFIILVYHYTHEQGNTVGVTPTEKQSIWKWVMGKVLVPKQTTTVTVETTPTDTTQTLP